MSTPAHDERAMVFISPEAYADPDSWHAQAAVLRRENPVARVEAEGWTPFWAISRHADVLEVSRRNDLYWNTEYSAPGPDLTYQFLQAAGIELPRTLVHLHGDIHNKYREVTNDWFKPAAVKGLQPAIDSIADDYVELLAEKGGECDFAVDVATPFTLRVIMSIFGVPPEDEAFMLKLTQGMFGAGDPEYLGDFTDPIDLVRSTIDDFAAYFDEISNDRRARPTGDLASVIANGRVDGEPLGVTESLWYYIIVATAGHDTTSYSMSGGLEQLLRHQDQLRMLQADPSLGVNAAEEMIRWTSPVRSFFRWVQEDTVLGGQELSAGDVVLTSYPSANRDDAAFDHPDEFDITRTDSKNLLSFGLGMHYCLGAQVARREVQTMIRKVLERVDTIELAGEPQWTAAHFVSGLKHLPITYTLK